MPFAHPVPPASGPFAGHFAAAFHTAFVASAPAFVVIAHYFARRPVARPFAGRQFRPVAPCYLRLTPIVPK